MSSLSISKTDILINPFIGSVNSEVFKWHDTQRVRIGVEAEFENRQPELLLV